MRRLVRCSAYSVASFLFVLGVTGFTSRVPEPAAVRVDAIRAWFADNQVGPGTWCRPVRAFPPAAGFRPTLATADAVLFANGFPPRPPAWQRRAARLWLKAVGRARTFVAPDPVCGSRRRSTIYSGNWAARVVPKSYYGNAAFTAAQSEWVQPAVPGDPNYADINHAPAVSLWTGVGITNLMQAGVDSISTATPRYKFWTEDYPQNMIWEGPPISAGQTAFVYVKNVGGNQAHYFLENVTTGAYSSFSNPLPYVGTDAANFVLERPNGLYLPSFGALNVWNNYFWQNGSSAELTSVSNRWVMTSDCRPGSSVLAQPSDVSGGQFSQSWSHSRPFANNC
jgi:Peptidase A4 family